MQPNAAVSATTSKAQVPADRTVLTGKRFERGTGEKGGGVASRAYDTYIQWRRTKTPRMETYVGQRGQRGSEAILAKETGRPKRGRTTDCITCIKTKPKRPSRAASDKSMQEKLHRGNMKTRTWNKRYHIPWEGSHLETPSSAQTDLLSTSQSGGCREEIRTRTHTHTHTHTHKDKDHDRSPSTPQT